MNAMTHRERILAAIHHKPVDRLPTDYWGTPEITRKLYDHFGCDTQLALYDHLGIDGILGAEPPYIGPALPTNTNAWGMVHQEQHYGSGVYDEQVGYPLANARSIADLDAYIFPNPDWYDYDALARQCAELVQHERAILVGYTAPFYYHNLLRGLELSLMDPLMRPEFTHALMKRISNFFTEYHQRCFEAAGKWIDLTQVTDDWGAQKGLLTSPRVFEEFYRAPTQRAIDLAKKHDLLVFHHDDGDMRPLLTRFVEMGIDVLNPLQWRCGDWDLPTLKAQYGQRICFHGGIDNQQTLPFGTPDDVREEVRRVIAALASDHTGYILAPCHNIQPNTPLENILAMYAAAKEYGEFK